MQPDVPARTALPSLLTTQLLASEVYAEFLRLSSDNEAFLWKRLLDEELEHVACLRRLMHEYIPYDLTFPVVNVEKMRELAGHLIRAGGELFLMRLEGALRLESAELDYGLEGLIAKRLEKNNMILDFVGDITEHITFLLGEARRYAESPNINRQMRRLADLLETSLSDTGYRAKKE